MNLQTVSIVLLVSLIHIIKKEKTGKEDSSNKILEAGKQKDVELSVQVTEFLAIDKVKI